MIKYQHFIIIFLFIFVSDVLYANKGRRKAPARRVSERALKPSDQLQTSTPARPTEVARPVTDMSVGPRENIEVIQGLLDRDANPNLQNVIPNEDPGSISRAKIADSIKRMESNGIQSKDFLFFVKDAETARHLINNLGFDVNARDNHGKTSLHVVQKAEVARVLLENGAEVGARIHTSVDDFIDEYVGRYDKFHSDGGNRGDTPLHTARNADVAKVLLEYDASVYAQNYFG